MGIIENKGRLKMLDKMEVYYFSPTGGTKKVSSIFADAMEKEVIWHDLGSKEPMMEKMRKKSINLQKLIKNSTAVENVQVPRKSPIQTRDEYAGCTNFPTILYEVWKMRNCLSDKRYFSCRWSSDYGYREMYSLHGMHPYLYGTGENSSASITAENGTDAWCLKWESETKMKCSYKEK